ncbi:hypothetical protein ACEPAF_6088 [Sanghuangporus sanghuang]
MSPGRCCNVWAPELHQIDGNSHIYYTAGVIANINNQHINVLQSGSNPMDPYTWRTSIIPDIWAIDATVANLAGSWYIFYPAFSSNNLQGLYAVRMSNPWIVTGSYSLISEPTLSWETEGMPVNEGPAVLVNGSRVWMRYSASYCWWTDGANGDYNPGHDGFFTSPDGSMTYKLYHASETSDVACDGTRRTFAQPVYWHTDGSPNFGGPRPISDLFSAPPGGGS